MYAERAEPKLELPKDLLAELQRRGTKPRTELHVEGWKPSFFNRLFGLFAAKRER
jgi:hypothetical protein